MTIACQKLSTKVNAIVITFVFLGVIALTTTYTYLPPYTQKKTSASVNTITTCWDLNGTRLLCQGNRDFCANSRETYIDLVRAYNYVNVPLYNELRKSYADTDQVHLIKTVSCDKETPKIGKVDEFGLYFAYAVIAAVPLGLCIMILYALTTNPSNTPNLAAYNCGACLFTCSPLALALYFFIKKELYKDVIFYTRASFLLLAFILACFIFWCMFKSSITATFITHTTTYWSDGAVTHSTSRDDYGYVDCREWPCLDNV